jgi:hypothetical protein
MGRFLFFLSQMLNRRTNVVLAYNLRLRTTRTASKTKNWKKLEMNIKSSQWVKVIEKLNAHPAIKAPLSN